MLACIKSQTWGTRICCRLRCVNAHDQQKGLKWCWNYFDEIVQSYDSHNRQWRSTDAWWGNGVCPRIGHILDCESPWKHFSSVVARKAFRCSYEWINGQKPHLIKDGIKIPGKRTSFLLCFRFVKFIFWIFINFIDTLKTGESFLIIQIREREDGINSDASPVHVSTKVDDRSGWLDDTQANKNQTPNEKETTMEWGCVLTSWNGFKNSAKIWWMKFQNMETFTPILLMKRLQCRLQRDVRIWVSTVFMLISPKTEIARSVNRPKLQGLREDAKATSWQIWWLNNSRPQSPKRQLRVSKQSSTRSRGTGSSHSMDPGVSVPNQNLSRNPEKFAKVPKTDNSLNWQSLWRSFLETLHVYTTQIRNKWDCCKSSTQSERRYVGSVVAIKSEWKLVGRFHGMLHVSAKRHRLIVWWEDVLWKTFWEAIWRTCHSFWFTSWISPFNCEGLVKNPSIWKESFNLDCSSDMHYTREEFGRLTYWSQTLRSWERCTHQKSTRKYSMRKRWYFSPRRNNLFFQSQMDESEPFEEIRNWEHPPWYGRDQFKEMVMLIFLENQNGLFHNLTTHFWNAGEAIADFWSMSGNFIYRHHVEPRVKFYSPGKESFPLPLKYLDVSRTTHTNLDIKQDTFCPVQSVVTPSLWWTFTVRLPPVCLPLPPWGGTLWPIFMVLFVLRFLEAVQCRQCFLEVRWMPCRHRIKIHHVRANPPVATVDVYFCSGGNMTVIFACKPIHFKNDLSGATQLDHPLPDGLVADESVVDVVTFLLAAFSLKLICRVVLFASRCFPTPVTVWPALFMWKFGMENKSSTDEMYFLFSTVSSFMRCPHAQYSCTLMHTACFAL